MCWSTNTRTPTGCRPRSCWHFKPTGRGLTVVGDDAQSIYSFRAATVRNILDFPGHFTPQADVVTLERNYRSTQPILAAANAVIDLAAERFTKNLWSDRASSELPALVNVADDDAQARYVVEHDSREPRSRHRAEIAGGAVPHLAATARTLEVELTRRNIPFVKFGGLKFLEAAHVKDVLAVLRWARQSARPRRRIPRRAAAARHRPGDGRASSSMRIADSRTPSRALASVQAARRGGRALAGVRRRRSARCISAAAGWPAELDLACRWYEPHLERIYEDAAHARRPISRSSRRSPRAIRRASAS